MNEITLIYPYYDNPKMLALQVENWDSYASKVKEAVKVIVIDDHSSKHKNPVPILEKCTVKVECYRVAARWAWNMHQCRNIGARVASRPNNRNPWMFMSDIDIVLPPDEAKRMLNKKLNPEMHYTMERVFAPEMTERKQHPNTFLVKHDVFWKVNGYDLDLTPIGGGGYGGDGQFMRQLRQVSVNGHFDNVVLVGYGRRERNGEPTLPDADTRDLDRNEWHARYVKALERKKAAKDMKSVNPIRLAYERTL